MEPPAALAWAAGTIYIVVTLAVVGGLFCVGYLAVCPAAIDTVKGWAYASVSSDTDEERRREYGITVLRVFRTLLDRHTRLLLLGVAWSWSSSALTLTFLEVDFHTADQIAQATAEIALWDEITATRFVHAAGVAGTATALAKRLIAAVASTRAAVLNTD